MSQAQRNTYLLGLAVVLLIGLLFRNLGGNRFEDVTHSMSEPDTGWSGDATATDLNGDGWPDLYVLNMQGARGSP